VQTTAGDRLGKVSAQHPFVGEETSRRRMFTYCRAALDGLADHRCRDLSGSGCSDFAFALRAKSANSFGMIETSRSRGHAGEAASDVFGTRAGGTAKLSVDASGAACDSGVSGRRSSRRSGCGFACVARDPRCFDHPEAVRRLRRARRKRNLDIQISDQVTAPVIRQTIKRGTAICEHAPARRLLADEGMLSHSPLPSRSRRGRLHGRSSIGAGGGPAIRRDRKRSIIGMPYRTLAQHGLSRRY